MTAVQFSLPSMNSHEQEMISQFIEQEFGIQMPPNKKPLLQSRLAKRVQACHLQNYKQYFEWIQKPEGKEEFVRFTDLISTHETSFFREKRHFKILSDRVVPYLVQELGRKTLRLLSAACSTGEEAYSLAMTLERSLNKHAFRSVNFEVEAVDLSEIVVQHAHIGIYSDERVHSIPLAFRKLYTMRNKDREKKMHRIVPELRARVNFHPGNLLGEMNLLSNEYDIIFCRNVLIYFNRANQKKTVQNLQERLSPGGFLFLGHSETMLGTELDLKSPFPSIYQKGRSG